MNKEKNTEKQVRISKGKSDKREKKDRKRRNIG